MENLLEKIPNWMEYIIYITIVYLVVRARTGGIYKMLLIKLMTYVEENSQEPAIKTIKASYKIDTKDEKPLVEMLLDKVRKAVPKAQTNLKTPEHKGKRFLRFLGRVILPNILRK